jgi:uncharacterized protein YdhG (YjbR/CyaY superfamily)
MTSIFEKRLNIDVEKYIKNVPPERRERINKLHTLILQLYPDAKVDMQYRMPTYRDGDGWVAIANQKNYISLYTCGYHHIEPFKARHPSIKTGKGCINFRDIDDMPIKDIEKVVRHAMEHPKPL